MPLSAAARIIVSVCTAVVGEQNVGAGGAGGASFSGSWSDEGLISAMVFFPLLRWVRIEDNNMTSGKTGLNKD